MAIIVPVGFDDSWILNILTDVTNPSMEYVKSDWNDLPVDIRSIDNVNKFKSKLKTFLFKRVYELS